MPLIMTLVNNVSLDTSHFPGMLQIPLTPLKICRRHDMVTSEKYKYFATSSNYNDYLKNNLYFSETFNHSTPFSEIVPLHRIQLSPGDQQRIGH